MWSALSISSSSDQSNEVSNHIKVPSSQVDDSFFNDLIEQVEPLPTPPKTQKDETPTKSVLKEVDESGAGDNIEDNSDWDVDGWEVSELHTPQHSKLVSSSNRTQQIDPELQQLVKMIMGELREYMFNFADPRATSELNEDLNEKPFSALMAYYASRPELAMYTVEHEVSRMQYEVTTENGQVVRCGKGDSKRIEEVMNTLQRVIDKEASNNTGEPNPAHVLIRMANQSLLADLLSALQDYLIKPELHTAVVVGTVSFNIDLEHMLLVCEAVFEVSTIQESTVRGRLSKDRILLGTLPCSVTVAAGFVQDLVFEFKRPELRVVLDDELARAATAIALQRQEEEAMDQAMSPQTQLNTSSQDSETPNGQDSSGSGGGGGLLSSFFSISPSTTPPPPAPASPQTDKSSFVRLYNLETPPKPKP